jgi:AAA15 family ATPase/GTPase
MKLHSLRVQNFRAIEDSKTLDFTDSLGKPRNVTLIVGPNGSGKTSILDAIQVVVKSAENPQKPELREGLEFSVQQLVYNSNSRINNPCKIEFEYSMEKDEVKAFSEINSIGHPASTLAAIWEYPKQQKENSFSISAKLENQKIIIYVITTFLGARGHLKKAISLNKVSKSLFERIGGVCYLDQRRSLKLVQSFSKENEDNLPHNDVLSWLREFFVKDKTWNVKEYGESYWTKVKQLFDKVCHPVELVGVTSGYDRDTLILRKNHIEYDLLQMSSGEHQILRILVGLVSERAKNSIVLIDEVELHLHPAWQTRLILALREDKESNNQYIFTTHSPFVKQLFYDNEIIDLGDLGE